MMIRPSTQIDSPTVLCGSTVAPFKQTIDPTHTSSPKTVLFTNDHDSTVDRQPTIESNTTECARITDPSITHERTTRAPRSTTACGPTTTPGPSSAPSSTLAVGSITTELLSAPWRTSQSMCICIPAKKSFGCPMSIQYPFSTIANSSPSDAMCGNTSFSMDIGLA